MYIFPYFQDKDADMVLAFMDAHPFALVIGTDANGLAVATQNYMTVQVRGTLRFMENHEMLDFMQRLSLHFEDGDGTSPSVFDNLSQAYKDSLMPAIAGFEIRVDSMQHTFKLSQNRDEVSYKNIISQLELRGAQANEIAQEMKRRHSVIFSSGEG